MGENVGAAARAMKNFGLAQLRLIAPKFEWPNDRAQMLASGAGDILQTATLHADAAGGLAGFNLVLATTARGRDIPREVLTPAEAAARLRDAAHRGLKTAILFGGERAGLDNDEISLCDALITIPTAEFSSLNLGQAVLLLGYEWFQAVDKTPASELVTNETRPAVKAELLNFFEHLEKELDDCGFLRNAEKRPSMVRNIRNLFQRAALTHQEIRTLHGIVAELATYRQRRKKG